MSDAGGSSSVELDNAQLTQGQRAVKKLKENPFIPIGFVATCTALVIALAKMQKRDAKGYQRWLRARVLAQGITVVAIIGAGVKEWDKFQFLGKKEGQKGSGRVIRAHQNSLEDQKEFEERMKAAEEAHRAESAISAQSLNSQAKSGAKVVSEQVAQKSQATAEQSDRPKSWSSWSSWFGVFSKSK